MLATKQLDVMKLMSVFTDFFSIFTAFTTCNGGLTDIAAFCLASGTNACTPDKVTANIQKNLFLIMAKFTDISNIMMGGVPKNAEEAYT